MKLIKNLLIYLLIFQTSFSQGLEGSKKQPNLIQKGANKLLDLNKDLENSSIIPKFFNFKLIHKSGYKNALGYYFSKNWDLNDKDTLYLNIGYSPYKLKNPFDDQRVHIMDYSLGLRHFIKPKLYSQLQGGVRYFKPNQSLRDFYLTRNEVFGPEHEPYLTLGLGYLLVKELPVLKRPLVVVANYTFSDDYQYPSKHPLGHHEFDFSGFSLGLRLGFRF